MSRNTKLAKAVAASMICHGTLTKVNAETRQVFGYVATEHPDHAGEIFDYDSSKPLFVEWSEGMQKASNGASYGNVRAMHGLTAAGKIDTALVFDDLGKTIACSAVIVDDAEWAKVLAGVYTGFSMGGAYIGPRWPDPSGLGKRYTGKPREVSLVDAPCIPNATFTVVKADGSEELRKFAAPAVGTEPATTGAAEAVIVAEVAEVEEPAAVGDDPGQAAYVAKAMGLTELPAGMLAKHGAMAIALLKRKDEPDVISALTAASQLTGAICKTDLAKGLWDVRSLACVLMDLDCVAMNASYEMEYEGDKSKVPQQLADAMRMLADVLILMTKEEVAELLAVYEKSAPIVELSEMDQLLKSIAEGSESEVRAYAAALCKASFAMSATIDTLQKATPAPAAVCTHNHGTDVGTEGDDLAKLNTALDESTNALRKIHADNTLLKSQNATLTKRVDELLKMPPSVESPRLIAIGKGEAEGTVVKVDAVSADGAVTPVLKADGTGKTDDVATLIKAAHAKGGQRVM